jgi:hypothetical protein
MQYKAIYQTGGAPGCSDHGKGNRTNGATPIHRFGGPKDPPLLFDLEKVKMLCRVFLFLLAVRSLCTFGGEAWLDTYIHALLHIG